MTSRRHRKSKRTVHREKGRIGCARQKEFDDVVTCTEADEPTLGARRHVYQRRVYVCCCILTGEMDRGGLATRMPVLGLTMGMALRDRRAEGW